MSILNFSQRTDDSATVVVDSLLSSGRPCSKLLAMPHLRGVVAGRGRLDVFMAVVTKLHQFASFDEAVDGLPDALAELLAALPAYDTALAAANGLSVEAMHAQQLGHVKHPNAQEILLVGFSERRGCIDSISVGRVEANESLKVTPSLGRQVAPPHADLIPDVIPALEFDAGAFAFTQRQYTLLVDGAPGFGGDVIVARVRAEGVLIRTVGRLVSKAVAVES